MKTTITLICIILATSGLVKAQVNLEFNQVVTMDTSYSVNFGSGNYTAWSNQYMVPPGKVWKIEYLSDNGGTFYINNVAIMMHYGYSTGAAQAAYAAFVVDAANDTSSLTSVIITEPSPLVLTISSTSPSCNLGNDGIAVLLMELFM